MTNHLFILFIISMSFLCSACHRSHEYKPESKVDNDNILISLIDAETDEKITRCDSIEQAKKHMDELKRTAQQVIREEGHDEPVEVCLTRMPFQTRVYENFSLPAGEYDALRVVIGKGEGHNWWCVLFPALCLPSGGSRELEGVMSAGEEEIVCESDRFEVRFMLVEWWEGICSWFR